jgi:hypothetical protein
MEQGFAAAEALKGLTTVQTDAEQAWKAIWEGCGWTYRSVATEDRMRRWLFTFTNGDATAVLHFNSRTGQMQKAWLWCAEGFRTALTMSDVLDFVGENT